MKSIKQMVKEEMNKQIVRSMRSSILTENVKNVYDATKLVREFRKSRSPKLGKARKALRLAESKLNEFFDQEWELEYGTEELSEEIDNSPVYDSLICIMDCAKELYMNVDIDSEIDPLITDKIRQAEELIRVACEAFKLAASEQEQIENDELSDEYIVTGDEYEEYDDDDEFEDDECLDCDDDINL